MQRLIAGTLQHRQARILGEGRVGRGTFAAIESRSLVRLNPAHKVTTRAQTDACGFVCHPHLYRITPHSGPTTIRRTSESACPTQNRKSLAIEPIRKIHTILTHSSTESA